VSRLNLAASDAVVRDAAEDAALNGASALGAVLTGYFAACGAHPGVLLSPLAVVLYGFGAARALDGRVRQPGLGGKRPRGFLPDEAIPDAARVGVATGPTAALIGLGYDKARRLSAVLKPGIALAKAEGASSRASLLTQIHDFGAAALTASAFYRPLIHVAGPSEGGMLTSSDFTTTPEVDLAAQRVNDGEGRLGVPWDDGSAGALELDYVAAIDAQGIAAVAAYHHCRSGMAVPELDLLAPLCAQPVIRSVTRVKPATALPLAVDLAIRFDARGRVASAECGADGSADRIAVSAPV